MILAQNSLAQSDELGLTHGCLPRSETAGKWIDYLRLYTREMCELGRVVVLNWADEELKVSSVPDNVEDWAGATVIGGPS